MSWCIFKERSDHTFLMYIEAFFKRVFSLSQSFSGTFMWMADVSSNLFLPSPSSLSKIPSIWPLWFLPLPFLVFLFCFESSGRNLGYFPFVSLKFLSNKCPGNRLAKKILYLAGGWDQISKFCPHPKVSPPVHIQIHFKKLKRNKGGNDYTYKHSCLNGNIFPVFKIELELIFLIDSTWPLSY